MTRSPSSPVPPGSVSIRRCTGHADYRRCVDLQQAVWNFDPIDVVSHHILAVATETGGQVLGAFDGDRMVGFAQSFAAHREGKVYLHSHMVAVLPEYQNHGIGRLLKMAQREDAIARGIDLIEWTFDPLETRNAYFNLARLGAIVRRYIPDFYGHSSSPLHANLPTDRLVAEWRLASPRVQARLAGKAAEPAPGATISVPRIMGELRRHDSSRAAEIQARIRREFLRSFEEGYTATGFAVNDTDGHYLLEKSYED
jgi:predicted GNAT superfamily acetyltransferase